MASAIRVYSGATGTGDGSSRANAYTTLAAAITAALATSPVSPIWVHKDHSETLSANTTYAAGATEDKILNVLCVSTDESALASITTPISSTGATYITFTGHAYCFGVSFTGGSGANNSGLGFNANGALSNWTFDSCALSIGGTGGAGSISLGNSAYPYRVTLINATLGFAHINQSIVLTNSGAALTIKGSLTITGTVPTNLINMLRVGLVSIEGADLTSIPSGKYIFAQPTSACRAIVKDCKLTSGTLYNTANSPPIGAQIQAIRCTTSTNASGIPVNALITSEGMATNDTTVVLSGGGTDGTNARSRKLSTSALASFTAPLEDQVIEIWNDQLAAITVSVEGLLSGSTTVPNNDDIWMEVEYLGDSASPRGSYVSTGKASILATGAALTASTATWNGTSGSVAPFKLVSPPFTPAQKGFLTIRVKAAKPSTVFNVDPKVTVSGGPQVSRTFDGPSGTIINETGSITPGANVNVYVPVPGRRVSR